MALSFNASSSPQLVNNCSSVTNDIPRPVFNVGESCLVDGKYYSQGDYNQLRRRNLEMFENKYMEILNDNTMDEYRRHRNLACIMNSLMDNIVNVTQQNNTRFTSNQSMENLIEQNKINIEKNEDQLLLNKDINLVKEHRVLSSDSRNKRIDMYYIVMFSLIVGIVIVILILQNFVL